MQKNLSAIDSKYGIMSDKGCDQAFHSQNPTQKLTRLFCMADKVNWLMVSLVVIGFSSMTFFFCFLPLAQWQCFSFL